MTTSTTTQVEVGRLEEPSEDLATRTKDGERSEHPFFQFQFVLIVISPVYHTSIKFRVVTLEKEFEYIYVFFKKDIPTLCGASFGG